MSFIQIIVLALVQGITEFLPISSSGHLILGSWLFNWPDQGLVFDIAVHVGTLAAVIAYFRREWIQLLFGITENRLVQVSDSGGEIRARSLALLILLGTVPLAVGGLLMKDGIENNFRTPEAVGWSLLVTAVALLVGELVGRRNRELSALKLSDSVIIGFAQMFSVLPGISRSGVTISAAIGLGMNRAAAARFSMMLATPAIAGAGLLLAVSAVDAETTVNLSAVFLGVCVSAFTGYLVIAGLIRFLKTRSFRPFIVYCAVVGILVLVATSLGV